MDNTIKLRLKLDEDFNKLMQTSQKTGIPITLRGERIVDFKVNGLDNDNYKPDVLVIEPTPFSFDLMIGEDSFPNVPFNKRKISEDVVLFQTSTHSYLKVNFKIRLDKIKESIHFTLSSKSNKIRDILNYELVKKNYNKCKIQIKVSNDEDELLFEDFCPEIEINEEYINFLKKIKYIDDKLNLNLSLNEDYVITNKDKIAADFICEVIKNRKFKIKNDIKIHFQISADDLKNGLNELNQGVFKQNNYIINLLGNEINLGECKLSMKESDYQLLNENEISNILKSNKGNKEEIDVNLLIKNHEKLYLNFN